MSVEVAVRNLEEIEQLLLEKKNELDKLDARRAELLSEIVEIKQAKKSRR